MFRTRGRAQAPLQHHVTGEILGRKVGRELGVAQQVANGLHHIALGIKAKLACRHLVAPFDAALRIEQHHAVGRGLDGGQKILQPLVAAMGFMMGPDHVAD